MILVITNVSGTAYDSNNVVIGAHSSLFVPEHELKDIKWDNDGTLTYLSTTQNYYNPFVSDGAAGDVPEFDLESSEAVAHLYAGIYDSLNAYISQANAKITNDPTVTYED